MRHAPHKLIPDSFTSLPSRTGVPATVQVVAAPGDDLDAIGYGVPQNGDVPAGLGIDRAALEGAGFTGRPGQSLIVPSGAAPFAVAVGIGDDDARGTAALRDAAATFARAAAHFGRIGLDIGTAFAVPASDAGRAITEGVLLARYSYDVLKTKPTTVPVELLQIIEADGDRIADTQSGATAGITLAAAENLARDLANTPPGHLTAVEYAETTMESAADFGLQVEVFDKAALIELRAGGILGVNAGSVDEPRMIVIRYRPENPTGHLALVGKGIMYDSGGISLKPSDPMHLAMKMDMAGSAAVFGAMTALRDLGCTTAVSAWLMCTDNMPSGSATKLGDVLVARNGTTVEVKNTDAEGRLVMMDALVLAAEEKPDAIVDIATLTGAAMRALGHLCAVVLGNNQPLVDRVLASAANTDEQACQFPLEHRYRSWLDSDIADIGNLGGANAGATTAALFLSEFVDGVPWAHIDIAGTMQSDTEDFWRRKGATGYGTRLLADLAMNFAR
ncbi:leucyl aminopeptidase family protein [Nakamurella lactea]|uniref:leucyl aminopeptidase family protein n=1 Tax=Nakamurella lactea TaxID=459515 RepID=UPI0003F82002|nr:M17 family peptidase N-terminal domain-containing protein [Nakamurella lactea]